MAESISDVRAKIKELEEKAAAAEASNKEELSLVLQKQLLTLRDKEERLASALGERTCLGPLHACMRPWGPCMHVCGLMVGQFAHLTSTHATHLRATSTRPGRPCTGCRPVAFWVLRSFKCGWAHT